MTEEIGDPSSRRADDPWPGARLPVGTSGTHGGWTTAAAGQPVAEAAARNFPARFLRMIDLPPARLPTTLTRWWRDVSRDGSVELGDRLCLEPPRRDEGGTWTMSGRMRCARRVHAVPVEVMCWPHLGLWTKLSLEPLGRVRLRRSYFSRGHRLLDELTAALVSASTSRTE